MGLNSLVRSKKFKNFMSKLYGWGAAVVILGALFKINHYPGANLMLIIGLGTEATIFFFSAFEPPYVEPDWSLVYPELAGMYHGQETEMPIKNKDLTKELDKMLADAKIGPELIHSLSKGLHNLSENTSKLGEVTNAAVATEDYVKNVKAATSTVGDLTQAYKKQSDVLSQENQVSEEYFKSLKSASSSAANLASAYASASETIKSDLNSTKDLVGNMSNAAASAKILQESYVKSAEILAKSAAALDFSSIEGGAYMQQLQKISGNLSALNSVYELQLKANEGNVQLNKDLQDKYALFLKNLNESIEQTSQYKQGVEMLAQNVAALNKVYGNMLVAMNVNPGK
ncbi:MAG TPA: gliding motility protein GldL [Bacteroidales bacterium]|nr:gliding motility protein GldL [Bacteroidales bacterium]